MAARSCGCEVHHFMGTLVAMSGIENWETSIRIISCMKYLTVEAGILICREKEQAQLSVPSALPAETLRLGVYGQEISGKP
jgi:hypothetical protein